MYTYNNTCIIAPAPLQAECGVILLSCWLLVWDHEASLPWQPLISCTLGTGTAGRRRELPSGCNQGLICWMCRWLRLLRNTIH